MSAIIKNQVFTAVHTVGGLLPADMLVRISEGKDVPGSKPADYGVILGSVTDEAERHWSYFKGLWRELRKQLPTDAEGKPATDHTGIALNRWVLPIFNELGFGLLPEVGGGGLVADDDPEKVFPLSHRWHHVPIHVPTWASDLDKRPGGSGTTPPQSLVQEALNRTSDHLWAVVTNGRQLRLLRDSSALATASYVEFDLEAIFDGELFNEFVLLYRLLHASRFQVGEGEPPATCWLEKWRTDAITSGTRALEQLRKGVQEAITTLGTGFLKHPANAELRENLDTKALHAALLRMVYRMLFLFVAEDRGALHPPGAGEKAKERYASYFSSTRLRAHARRRRGTAHADQYRALKLVLDALGGNGKGNENGRPELAMPALGGLFTDTEADAPLTGLELSNEALLGAVRHLAQVRDTQSKRWRPVDYRHMGAEELGSIYESLLELVPKHSAAERTFELVELAGNDRKTTGSYYTPSSLIETLLDSALDPVIDDAVKRGSVAASGAGQPDESEAVVAELLKLTVCDPACGSGHFLVAAARRIAKKVAAVREGNPEPTVDAVRSAMHEVVARCIYGVDLNPMAVELAKVSLWLEALEPGKPLSFLDAHIKRGNALIGATPNLIRGGIPSEAFKPIEGDNKAFARYLAKTNEHEHGDQLTISDAMEETVEVDNQVLAQQLRKIIDAPSDKLSQVRKQESEYQQWANSTDFLHSQRVADAWCASFVWRKADNFPPAVTQMLFKELSGGGEIDPVSIEEIQRLREQYLFFHWHLEFPDVFTAMEAQTVSGAGWSGGFSCVLGNPPWERIKLQEQEFFAQRDEGIAKAKNAAARKRMIEDLREDPEGQDLYREFVAAKRLAEGESHFARVSGKYPLTGKGDINTYALFAETATLVNSDKGFFGMVLPTGIATDATTAAFFSSLVISGRLASFLDFENEAFLLSRDVHHSVRFCLLSVAGKKNRVDAATFAFSTRYMEDLPGRRFAMPLQEIMLVNPNTKTLPVFRSRRDAEITLGIYRRIPVLMKEEPRDNPWELSFLRMFDMTNDSHLFEFDEKLLAQYWKREGGIFVREGRRMLPLQEAKMIHHYDHRMGTYQGQTEKQANMGTLPRSTPEQHDSPHFQTMPRYWVPEFDTPAGKVNAKGRPAYYSGVSSRLSEKGWAHGWLLGWRDITNSGNERTLICSSFPRFAVGNSIFVMLPGALEGVAVLQACLSSFVVDYVSRQKISGSHLTYGYFYQLPVVNKRILSDSFVLIEKWIRGRVIELSYASYDMGAFAKDLGEEGAPFRWNEERRAVMRAELDALFFHLYGINRDDVDYIMETFPIVKKKDVAEYGSYRTKERILEIYDRMAEAGISQDTPLVDGENFVSELTPPPGHGPRHAPA